jgi:hypothetical protein
MCNVLFLKNFDSCGSLQKYFKLFRQTEAEKYFDSFF